MSSYARTPDAISDKAEWREDGDDEDGFLQAVGEVLMMLSAQSRLFVILRQLP